MDQKNDQIIGFDYPDLDLSDQQSPKKQNDKNQSSGQPYKKQKIQQNMQKGNSKQQGQYKKQQISNIKAGSQKFSLPFFPPPPGTGKVNTAWIPPPPIAHKNPQNTRDNQNFSRPSYQKNQYNQSRTDNKQKKNTVYVKNIPKSFNTVDKLMTFFKNEGAIKQIKVNQVQQSAVIKFVKEENAAKFLKSNKIIFNRSYIIYGQHQNISVSQQNINDRMNDEQGNVKKAEQTNLKVLKQKRSNQISQQIRAIYFLQNYLIQDQQANQIKTKIQQDFQYKIQLKKLLQNQNQQKFKSQFNKQNQYDWSLQFLRKSNTIIQRKNLFTQFLKYGPIINIEIDLVSQEKQHIKEKQVQQSEKNIIYSYNIKLLFLSVKNAWAFYNAKKKEYPIDIKGDTIKNVFNSEKLKYVQLNKVAEIEEEQKNQATQSNEKAKPVDQKQSNIIKSIDPVDQRKPDNNLVNENQIVRQNGQKN